MRPVPLFTDPSVLRLLEPDPLSDEAGTHAAYLASHVAGDILVVADTDDRCRHLTEFLTSRDAVTSLTAVHNSAARASDVAAVTLPDREFDTIVYTKAQCGWFARSPDFHQLTDRLRRGGTLLGQTKWVPDSDTVVLEEIAVADPRGFAVPNVYLRWRKPVSQTALDAYAADGDGRPAGAVQPARQRAVPRADAVATRAWRSQYQAADDVTDYRPGWRWHTRLTEFVRETLLEDADRVANLCCGTTTLGDIRVDALTDIPDLDTSTAATVQGDARRLPIATNTVDAVVTDPPWKIPRMDRIRLFSEAVRITTPGGRVVQNSWWLPHHPYAPLSMVWPVTANVTDDSLTGPGGLSFLSSFTVTDHPGHADAAYTLADHATRDPASPLDAYRDWPTHPTEQPALDPRLIKSRYRCQACGEVAAPTPVHVGDRLLYQCTHCAFRHAPRGLLS